MKRRLIFTLLYEDGHFVLSRNFRTQKVGNLGWLQKNYDFSKVASYLDELVIINVSSDPSTLDQFKETVQAVAEGCFAPITAGGGICSESDAHSLFRHGADKVLINRALYEDHRLVEALAGRYGRQAIVGSLDFKKQVDGYTLVSHRATRPQPWGPVEQILNSGMVGEIYATSVLQDGTGQGMDSEIVAELRSRIRSRVPVILAGGAGKPEHLLEPLQNPAVSGVATANLLNFIGDGLKRTRQSLRAAGIDLARWDVAESDLKPSRS